ncbi:pirin family protein [Leptospira idonii]|uniref:Pirin family protein n=1 Tax=Leptospira idonii TaxID=1193500 RepID=A0A4R9LY38_9LEPT|nr:pirin family protein [Leptospira idonii]TGN19210.1 pirin family protein [Leptospira idonii]
MGRRKISYKTSGIAATDGAGVKLRRMIGTEDIPNLDPFLMLDEFKSDSPDDYLAGFPNHPHRGFETVTYLLEGIMEHNDSKGNRGILEKGGVQWMTAGRGIVHSEMPKQENGMMRGYQLWVNLPSGLKMIEPGYFDVSRKDWKRLESEDGHIDILAGEISGIQGPAKSKTPLLYSHWYIKPNGSLKIPVSSQWNGFVHVAEGNIEIENESLPTGFLGVFGSGEEIVIENKTNSPAEGILVLGEPIREPIVQYGPFVMNTKEEIMQAFTDFQSGNFGH